MSDLRAVRDQLTQKLESLQARAGRIDDHLHNRNREVPADWSDAAQFQQGEEVVEALEPHTHAEITALQEAIARIDRGDWAVCSHCGGAIEPKRLKVLPTTNLCTRCI